MTLLRRHIMCLEKVFLAEIDDAVPVQSKAKTFDELVRRGYARVGQRVNGPGTKFPVIVTGYFLTEKGRAAYSSWADNHMSPRGSQEL